MRVSGKYLLLECFVRVIQVNSQFQSAIYFCNKSMYIAHAHLMMQYFSFLFDFFLGFAHLVMISFGEVLITASVIAGIF